MMQAAIAPRSDVRTNLIHFVDYVPAMGRIVGFRQSKQQPLPGPLNFFKRDDKIQFAVALTKNTQSTVIK